MTVSHDFLSVLIDDVGSPDGYQFLYIVFVLHVECFARFVKQLRPRRPGLIY